MGFDKSNPRSWRDIIDGIRLQVCRRIRDAAFLLLMTGLTSMQGVAADQKPLRVLALGDSLTAGYGLAPEQGLVPRLQAALAAARGPDARKVEIINAGVSGDTSAGGLARLDWSLADQPDAAIVELGANDMLRGVDPATTEHNLDEILTRLQQRPIPILLVGMRAARNWGPDYQTHFDQIYQRLADAHHVALYPFYFDGVLEPQYLQGDGLHPNAIGVGRIVERLLPYVQRLVAAPGGTSEEHQ
jgi:acyl-CoA thioesterase-1